MRMKVDSEYVGDVDWEKVVALHEKLKGRVDRPKEWDRPTNGRIWKEGKVWKIQFPYGIVTVKKRHQAEILSEGFFGKREKEGREI